MAEDLDATLAALADPTRRRVVDALRDRPRRAGELAALVGVSAPALSRHLRVLRSSGVVTADFVEDDARGRQYALRIEPFVALEAWLDQVHAFWRDQLDGFVDHVDRAIASGRVAGAAPGNRTTRGKRR
jgi:DNA-binding transcriptional ArsR family regulator